MQSLGPPAYLHRQARHRERWRVSRWERPEGNAAMTEVDWHVKVGNSLDLSATRVVAEVAVELARKLWSWSL